MESDNHNSKIDRIAAMTAYMSWRDTRSAALEVLGLLRLPHAVAEEIKAARRRVHEVREERLRLRAVVEAEAPLAQRVERWRATTEYREMRCYPWWPRYRSFGAFLASTVDSARA